MPPWEFDASLFHLLDAISRGQVAGDVIDLGREKAPALESAGVAGPKSPRKQSGRAPLRDG